jgi:hypothetical protein
VSPEKLKSAVDSILTNDTNTHIDATISQLEGDLRRNGVKNTRFVGQLLYSFRGVQQGVPGDLQKFKQAVQMAQTAGALGPRGAAALLAKAGSADNTRRVENSILNVKNQPKPRQPFQSVFENPLLKAATSKSRPQDIFQKPQQRADTTQKKSAQTTQPKPSPKKGEVSPTLERAITSIDIAAKSMPEGVVKSALEAVHSSMELAKEAQQNGDKAAYTRAITDLSSKTFALVGAMVKTYGQNPALAELAAKQLGHIAGVLGKVAGPLKLLDNASKVFAGTTLGGTPVDKNARADAVYDLVSNAMPAPIQAAMGITKVALEALYTHLGVPAQRSIEAYGLKNLFGGKSPEEMKAMIQALPTDAANANATVRKLLSIFPNTGAFGASKATANDLWRQTMSREMASDSDELKAMVNQDPRKPNSVPDMNREVVADRMKSAALRFVDQQVREARGNW